MALATFMIHGRLEKPVEIRDISTGQVANLFLRTVPELRLDGTLASRQQTLPITVYAANLIRDIVPYLQPGHTLVVSGRIERRRYESQGRTIYTNALVATSIAITGGPNADVGMVAEATTPQEETPELTARDVTDIPF